MKNCNKVKAVSKTGVFLNLISYLTRWNLKHKGEHKREDWTNLETIS